MTTPVTATVAVRATTTVAAGAGDTAVSDVAEETHALVRAGHCAQVGDNLVDQVREPVGTAERTRDELWLTVATMSGVPNEFPVDARVVHTRRPAETAVDQAICTAIDEFARVAVCSREPRKAAGCR